MKIGLVLSGGGARCFAQIGVLKALEEKGLEPSAICGTSTGALLGALYAAGHRADKLFEIVEQIDYSSFLRPGSRSGLLDHSGIEEVLKPYLPETFEELAIPLAVTVVDIQDADLLVLREGSLLKAACASNAFPGLFEPVEYQGRYLMDGGILDNFPVDLGRIMTTNPLVAISVVPSPKRKLDFDGQGEPRFMERLLAPLRGGSPGLPLIVDVLEKAYTITQSRLINVRTAMFSPNLIITPDLPNDLGIQDFDRLEEAYELGYAAGREAMTKGPLDF